MLKKIGATSESVENFLKNVIFLEVLQNVKNRLVFAKKKYREYCNKV
jgi:hypothetical protein